MGDVLKTVAKARNYVRQSKFRLALIAYENIYDDLHQRIQAETDNTARNDMVSARAIVKAELEGVKEVLAEFNSLVWQPSARRDTPPSDPEVWQPPSPKPVPKQRAAVKSVRPNPATSAVKKPGERRASDSNPPPRRGAANRSAVPSPASVNYSTVAEKPVRQVVSASDMPPADNENDDSEEKKEFDAFGCDAELVDMIKSTMLMKHPNVHWNDIAGLEEAKRLLTEAIVLPMAIPEFFTGIRRAWKGICMCGPPGTGKTLLAKAVATECNTTFFSVSSSSMASKYRGDSEKLVKLLFTMARFYAPSVIFFDEVDSACSHRGAEGEHEASRRFKSELLVQMDGCIDGTDKPVLVLAATNHPWLLDSALLRRMEKRIYIGLPDLAGRIAFLKSNFSEVKLAEDVDFETLAHELEGYSGSDIASICRDAALAPLRDYTKNLSLDECKAPDVTKFDLPLEMRHFRTAISRASPTSSPKDIEKYIKWMEEHGST
uniref:Katanin p60 ATPase-containing subunit A1 n=1 Tax=Panagrellus redivivus TaxID=6233 RepID=A0A7E4V2G3_PANRE